jgi:hypothetical protein
MELAGLPPATSLKRRGLPLECALLRSGAIMSHKQANLLHAIFNEPVSANIHWREVESLLKHLGGQVEPSHGARFKVTLNGVTDFLHHPHHSNECTRELIKHLREFLAHAGVSVSTYEAEKGQ